MTFLMLLPEIDLSILRTKMVGILDFEPVNVTKKHIHQSDWKCVAVIKTDCDMDDYLAWFLERRFNLKLCRNLRSAHITIISDRMNKTSFQEGAPLFNGKEIEFSIERQPRSNGKHWWVKVDCPQAEAIRKSLGLSETPYFDFHFTIGHANEKNLEHSKYVYDQILKFEQNIRL